ncbi:MAG: MBL fold metallo-hydrolase [Nitriliruptorales bacterium]|nr:MBL fold metallo-hydrolase [Nitriliruptorales bacterium]
MTYTGHVEPDGPRIERRDGRLLVRKFSVEEMDNNVYIIADAQTRDALIVDAAARPQRILDEVADLEALAVVQTHGHWDHVRAWDGLVDAGLPVWGHPGDAELFPHDLDRELTHGDTIGVGELDVEVIHTPGHTDGSLHYLVRGEERPHLFTGDSLFPGGPGNTWNDADRFRQLMGGLKEKVFGPLPDETWVYPGHGDDTTLGEERPKIPEWEERGW